MLAGQPLGAATCTLLARLNIPAAYCGVLAVNNWVDAGIFHVEVTVLCEGSGSLHASCNIEQLVDRCVDMVRLHACMHLRVC